MTTSIAITGTQGSGKSSLTARLHGICRRKGRNVVTEVADDCPHPLNTDADVEGQAWIWRVQLRRELEARNARPDVLICDRSMMCNLCYLALVEGDQAKKLFSELYGISHQWMRTYDHVVRLPMNLGWLQSGNNPKRSTDIEFARRIDAVYDNLVDRYVNITTDDLIGLLENSQNADHAARPHH